MRKDRQAMVNALETQAAESNEKLAATLQQLAYQVQPRTQVDHLIDNLVYQADKVRYAVVSTIDKAREGDPEARMRVLKGVAVGAAAVGLLVLRRKLKRRRR